MAFNIKNLPSIASKFPQMAEALRDIGQAITNLGNGVAVSPTATIQPPPNITGIQVKALKGNLYNVQITDNSNININIEYFVEVSTTSAFSPATTFYYQLLQKRSDFIALPEGNWFFRAYSQYVGGSTANTPVVFGGTGTPKSVNAVGVTDTTPLTSTGIGTATNTGQGAGGTLFKSSTGQNPTLF